MKTGERNGAQQVARGAVAVNVVRAPMPVPLQRVGCHAYADTGTDPITVYVDPALPPADAYAAVSRLVRQARRT